jgi:hypothetical protein
MLPEPTTGGSKTRTPVLEPLRAASSVLHSDVHAATTFSVPGFTVHVSVGLPSTGANGATTPPRSTQGSPPVGPKRFCGVGVSITFCHKAPRVAPSFLSGTAADEGAVTPKATAATSNTRERRDTATSFGIACRTIPHPRGVVNPPSRIARGWRRLLRRVRLIDRT